MNLKRYYILLGLIIFSLLGTSITDLALGIWMLKEKGADTLTYTLIVFFAVTPNILLSPLIGSFVDRLNLKKVMLAGQLVSASVSVILMILYFNDRLTAHHIMFFSLFASIANGFLYKAFYKFTKFAVEKEKLNKAKGIEMTGLSLVTIFSPVFTPVIYDYFGLIGVFSIDVFSFSIAIIGIILLKIHNSQQVKEKFMFFDDLKSILRFYNNHKSLPLFLCFDFFITYTVGTLSVMLVPFILDFSDETTLTKTSILGGIAMMFGGILISLKKKVHQPVKTIVFVNLLVGIIIALTPIVFNYYILYLGIFLIMFCYAIIFSNYNIIWQSIVPENMQARELGVREFLVGLAMPIALLISGLIIQNLISPFFDKNQMDFLFSIGKPTSRSIAILFSILGIFNVLASIIIFKKIAKIDRIYQLKLEN